MSDEIRDVEALEACIGPTPGPMHLKVIDHLDEGARRWLSASSVMFAGFGTPDGPAVMIAGGAPGFAAATDALRLSLPLESLDRPDLAREGAGFGALVLVPTIGETLRINGRVAAIRDASVEIAVEECYVHCAKALIRSGFREARSLAETPSEIAAFLRASRFLALATIDAEGRADVSPKGDPPGATILMTGGAIRFADRPGNRRADSFRNILRQRRVALAALIPGAPVVALISGEATVSKDEAARAAFAVDGKMPNLTTAISGAQLELMHSPALERACLWPPRQPVVPIDAAAVLAGHVRLSRARGVQATLARAAVSVPGLMRKGLERDYRTNLY